MTRLDDIKARQERACQHVGDLCDPNKPSVRWTMRIPAEPDRDSDLIISASLNDIDWLIEMVESLVEALADIRDMVPDEVPKPDPHPPCDECAKRQKAGWPPSGLCEDHYRDVSAYLRRVKQSEDVQRFRMRRIARDALAAYDEETP